MPANLDPNSTPVNTSYFLDQFSVDRRGVIGNRFFKVARDGATTVEELIRTVKADTISRMLFAKRSEWNQERGLLALLDTSEARVYAQEVLNRGCLSPQERQKQRAERQEHYRKMFMASQHPTERQFRFLKHLGCDVTPTNRLEASDLIEVHKK